MAPAGVLAPVRHLPDPTGHEGRPAAFLSERVTPPEPLFCLPSAPFFPRFLVARHCTLTVTLFQKPGNDSTEDGSLLREPRERAPVRPAGLPGLARPTSGNNAALPGRPARRTPGPLTLREGHFAPRQRPDSGRSRTGSCSVGSTLRNVERHERSEKPSKF